VETEYDVRTLARFTQWGYKDANRARPMTGGWIAPVAWKRHGTRYLMRGRGARAGRSAAPFSTKRLGASWCRNPQSQDLNVLVAASVVALQSSATYR